MAMLLKHKGIQMIKWKKYTDKSYEERMEKVNAYYDQLFFNLNEEKL